MFLQKKENNKIVFSTSVVVFFWIYSLYEKTAIAYSGLLHVVYDDERTAIARLYL